MKLLYVILIRIHIYKLLYMKILKSLSLGLSLYSFLSLDLSLRESALCSVSRPLSLSLCALSRSRSLFLCALSLLLSLSALYSLPLSRSLSLALSPALALSRSALSLSLSSSALQSVSPFSRKAIFDNL